ADRPIAPSRQNVTFQHPLGFCIGRGRQVLLAVAIQIVLQYDRKGVGLWGRRELPQFLFHAWVETRAHALKCALRLAPCPCRLDRRIMADSEASQATVDAIEHRPGLAAAI